MGPAKLENFGDEVLAVLDAAAEAADEPLEVQQTPFAVEGNGSGCLGRVLDLQDPGKRPGAPKA